MPRLKPARDDRGTAELRAAAERVCDAHEPTCDWPATFSSLERASIARVLAARGYQPEPQPWGKVIAHVRVFNEDVFAEQNWLSFLNHVHYTTREQPIRDELTIHEGEVWDAERVAETSRRLRDPLYSSVIALLPVKAAEPGMVDLLVITRDVWSLRFNTQYTFQESSLTNLAISISENNFLGHRDVLAASMVMDQGAVAIGPLFIDKNLLGKHLDFRVRVDQIFTRRSLDVVADGTGTTPAGERTPTGDPGGIQDLRTFRSEGSDSTITLSRPLWSLASEWGGGASFSHRFAVARSFYRTGLRGYDDPDTPQDDLLPREYKLRVWSVSENAVRQWGTAFKQQMSFGHTVTSQRPTLLPGFPGDDQQRADFIRDVLPRSEVTSHVFVSYSLFVPSYRTLRYVGTYDLAEDVRLGPDASVTFAQGLKVLGSDANFQRPSGSIGWTFPWCADGYVRPSAALNLRIQDGRTIDNVVAGELRAVSPLYRYVRFIADASIESRWHDTQNQYYTLGSDNGLRGYGIGQFFGQRRVSGALEARSIAVPLWALRIGGVAFYEIGGAADTLRGMRLGHDVGIGFRMLIPQTSRELFRFDLAFPLVSAPDTPAGRPHFIAGFDSYF